MTEKSKFGHFSSSNAQVTTLEGLLQRTITGLSQDQPIRRALHPDDAEKIDQYIERVEQLLSVSKPFELTVVDPSGNSWVENPHAPAADSGRVEEWFERSREEDNLLGLYSQEQLKEEYEQDEEVKPLTEERLKEEVIFEHSLFLDVVLPVEKKNCKKSSGVDIPHQLWRVQRPSQHQHENHQHPILQGQLNFSNKFIILSNPNIPGGCHNVHIM